MQRAFALFIFILLALPAMADLDGFEEALDRYDFPRAEKELSTLSDSNLKSLCEAELLLKKGRPVLSVKAMEVFQASALEPSYKGKFLLVRALQEHSRRDLSDSERVKTVLRFLRNGLRSSPRPRDRARLLLVRVSATPASKLDLAEEAEAELAEMEDDFSEFALEAQALLLERRGRFSRAAKLWATLATLAKEHPRLRVVRLGKEISALEAGEKKERAGKIYQKIVAQAKTDKDPFVIWQAWLHREGYLTKPQELVLANELVAIAPDSVEKIKLLGAVGYSTMDKAAKIKVAEEALALAKTLGDKLWHAYELRGTRYYTASKTKEKRILREASELLAGYDLRYVRNTSYSSLYKPPQVTTSANPATLEQLKKASKELSDAISELKAKEAKAAQQKYLELALTLPEADRWKQFDTLYWKISNQASFYSVGSSPDKQHLIATALRKTLVTEIKQRPDVVAALIDSYLERIDNEHNPEKVWSRYTSLAFWLHILERDQECTALIELAKSFPQSKDGAFLRILSLLHQLRLKKPPSAAELDELIALRRANNQLDWEKLAHFGWFEFYCGRYARAVSLGQEALKESRGVSRWNLMYRGVHQLIAFSKARQGSTEEAFQVLEEAERNFGSTYDPEYLLARALLMNDLGRHKDTYISTLGLVKKRAPDERLISTALRLKSAEELGKSAEAEQARKDLEEFLEGVLQLSQHPIFEHHLRTELAERIGLSKPEPITVNTGFNKLPAVLERLEALRRREPDNQTLRRLGSSEIRNLMQKAGDDEIYVQPILMPHSVVLLSVVNNQANLEEIVCDRRRLDKALLSLSTKLSSPNTDTSYLSEDQRYLSEVLVKPWQSRFPGKNRLRWLGEDELKSLPLSALPDSQGRPLMESLVTAYLDGPDYNELKVSSKKHALLITGASDLAGAAREVESVKSYFKTNREWSLKDDMATLKELSKDHSVVHIATHGKAPTGEALGGRLAGDGEQISAFQLAELSFPENTLAVVGTCESNVDAHTGRDNSSLVSALRTAGAQVVIGSLWRLDDAVTAELFGEFYGAVSRGAAPDEALALAQRSIAAQSSHPYYWAGLQAVSGP